jgi:uncharacterized membrane protein
VNALPDARVVPARARRWSVATAAVLAACVTAAALRSAPLPSSLAWAALMLLPLLLPLPGILRGTPRTFAWGTLCVAPYFVYGLTEVVANPALRVAAGAILFASLGWFASLVHGPRAAAAQSTPAG